MLGTVIKTTLQKAVLYLEEYAHYFKYDFSTVNRWKIGNVKPNLTTITTLKKFCRKNSFQSDNSEKGWLGLSYEK